MIGKSLFAHQQGYLATDYKDCFNEEVTADTIHATFQYPVCHSGKPTYNWNLSNYDIILIDELSMVQ